MNRQTALEELEWLPEQLKQRVERNVPLAPITWFRVGGNASYMFRLKTKAELVELLRHMPDNLPRLALGVGSNVLIRDGGVAGAVIRLAGEFGAITVEADHCIRAGAAALDVAVARFAQKNSVGGLEFLRGIPGTIGGALRMNAGAYGHELKDVLIEATAIDRRGNMGTYSVADLKYAYRSCGAAADLIFVEALLRGQPANADDIAARMSEITEARESSQPVRSRTGGSTFKNPDPDLSGGRRAWELIDEAGCRGLRVGDAQVSEHHCNFLINHGQATAQELESLGELVRNKVLEKTSVQLEWEIKRLGREKTDGR